MAYRGFRERTSPRADYYDTPVQRPAVSLSAALAYPLSGSEAAQPPVLRDRDHNTGLLSALSKPTSGRHFSPSPVRWADQLDPGESPSDMSTPTPQTHFDRRAAEAQLREARALISQRHAQLIEADAKIGALERQLQDVRRDRQEQRAAREKAEQRIRELEESLEDKGVWWVESIKQHEDYSRGERESRIRAEQEAAVAKCELEADITKLWATVRELKMQLEEKKQAARRAREERAAVEQRLRDKSEGNKALIEALNRRDAQCAAEMELERDVHSRVVQQLRGDSEQREEVVRQLRSANDELSADCRRMRDEVADTRQQLDGALDALRDRDEQLERMRADAAAAQAALKSAHAEELQASRDAVQQERRLRQTQEASVQAATDALDRERLARREAATALGRQQDKARAEGVQWRKEKRGLQDEISGLRADLSVAEGAMQDMRRQLDDRDAQFRVVLDRKEGELRRLEDEVVRLRELLPDSMLCHEEDELLQRQQTVRLTLAAAISDLRWLNDVARAKGTSELLRFVGGNQESTEDQEHRAQGKRVEELCNMLQDEMGDLLRHAQLSVAHADGCPDDSGCAMQ
eukprot:TRINITY_DN23667_c0_g1_i2.p1 TRINITY_DN23667_c0_g1~~TRINITY_DN23667_c0_g1_i2.p1  ORF type:complete len:617 (+),score=241.36 TRINITY_DN23667_c0_g1_i2:110-1852(+)